jgi:hypothetical protein
MSSDERTSRAEARRRARMAARGELPEPIEPEDDEPAQAEGRGGFLTRMFPPAPPLSGRPEPLAGYDGSGLPRFIGERAYLLRRNLLAWIPMGLAAFVAYIASLSYGSSLIGLVGTFTLFGSLIAAGWFGWQRPTLFGTAAAIVGFILAAALVLLSFARLGVGPDTFGLEAIGQLFIQALYLAGLGFLGGWYGGYLRRRQAQLSAQQRPRQRRR